jgi:hypothetical protein
MNMESFSALLEIIGLVTTLYAVLWFFWMLICWALGIYPVFTRLGFGRWFRRIHVVATLEKYNELKDDMVSTGMFRASNIYHVSNGTLTKLKEASLALVHYQSFSEDEIRTIISNKRANAGYIFYFPEFVPGQNAIPTDTLKLINNEQFTTVVNMRGRLMNDIMVTLLSTGYDKK